MEFTSVPKFDRAPKYWCHFKAFAMVSKKKFKKIGCRTIFTFKTTKNGEIWSKIEIFGPDKMRRSSKHLVPFESFWSGEWGKIAKFWLSHHFHLQNDQKRGKLDKNWNFRAWQNATELQKFCAIWKLLKWWVRKNCKILVVAPFSPSKRQKTWKIGQKLKFLGLTKCDGAPKIWCHLKAFAHVSEEKLQHFGCPTIFTFRMTKTEKNGQKLKFSGSLKCDGAQKFWCLIKACAMVSKKKLWNFCYCTIFTFKMTAKIPLCYKGARQFKGDNLVVTLDPYPSISCNSHRNSILERIRLPQKRPNHICCRIFIRSYNFPQNGRREDEYDFPNKNLHCQSKLHRATDSRTYLNIISRLEAFFKSHYLSTCQLRRKFSLTICLLLRIMYLD